MARIKIEMIEDFVFKTELAIRISDLNYTNHVDNDAFVSIIHEAREKFLENFDFTKTNVNGKGLIVSDLAVSYQSLSFYGDKLKFEIGAGDFNQYGCDIFYRVTNTKTNDLILLAKTGIVFFDYAENKITTTPEAFSSHFL